METSCRTGNALNNKGGKEKKREEDTGNHGKKADFQRVTGSLWELEKGAKREGSARRRPYSITKDKKTYYMSKIETKGSEKDNEGSRGKHSGKRTDREPGKRVNIRNLGGRQEESRREGGEPIWERVAEALGNNVPKERLETTAPICNKIFRKED